MRSHLVRVAVCAAAAWLLVWAAPFAPLHAAEATPSPELSPQWEELTAPDFVRALSRSAETAIVPLGIIEKHGPHLPLGTDLLDVRELVSRAVDEEYTLVFPPYYFGQIFEARHQPGTLAYSQRLIWDALQETVDEIARNGVRKIILVNGHGGNNSFLPFFCQSQLARRRDYAVYLFQPAKDPEEEAGLQAMRKTPLDLHAGEVETSTLLAHRPDLARVERAGTQPGQDQNRLAGLIDTYTAIWWYARFPNHYAGDGTPATAEFGDAILSARAKQLVAMIRAVKADSRALELQRQFFDQAEKPTATPQP